MRKCKVRNWKANKEEMPFLDAIFHAFGLEMSDEEPSCSYSVAIVEFEDGVVNTVFPYDVVFTDK